jgi:histidine triad (HIT) family protein
MSDGCIFCKIISGELPATKVYEDDHTLAFMDISPVIHGHALVIPKAHYEQIAEVPDEDLARCIAVAKRVAHAQEEALGANGVNLHQANGAVAGQVVPHIHFHVIPRFDDDGHHWNWTHRDYDSMDDMATTGETLAAAIK